MVKKIFLGIGIVFAVFVLTMIILMGTISTVNKPKGDKQEVLASSTQNTKKALVVYQPSLSDITTKVAHQIAKGLNEGGYEVTLNHPGDHMPTDISNYALVIFGTPNFVDKPATVLTDYISKVGPTIKGKIVLFSTGMKPLADGEKPLEIEGMEKSLNGVKPYQKIKFNTKDKENEKKAYELGKKLSEE